MLIRLIVFCVLVVFLPIARADDHAAPRTSEAATQPASALAILRDNCFSCHNEKKHKGKLILTSREAALRGNDDGPALVPQRADKSRLIRNLAADADPHMPPKSQLAADDVAALRRWIDAGAPWDAALLADAPPTTRPATLQPLPATYHPVLSIAISPDGRRLAAGRGNRVDVYDLAGSLAFARSLEGPKDVVRALAWSKDGNFLAAGDYGQILVWDLRSPTPPLRLGGVNGRVTALLFLENGQLLAADGDPAAPARILRYELPGGDPRDAVEAHSDTVMALCATSDGSLLASGGADKLVKLWETSSLREVGRLEGHSGHVLALAFNADGSLLASAGADKEIKLWEVKTRQQKLTIGPHPAALTALAWEGKIFAAAEDGVVRVDADSTSEPGRALAAAEDVLYALAVSPDSKRICAGCHDGRVYVWDAQGKLVAQLDPPAEH